jgi:hypothetical protein
MSITRTYIVLISRAFLTRRRFRRRVIDSNAQNTERVFREHSQKCGRRLSREGASADVSVVGIATRGVSGLEGKLCRQVRLGRHGWTQYLLVTNRPGGWNDRHAGRILQNAFRTRAYKYRTRDAVQGNQKQRLISLLLFNIIIFAS